MFAMIMIRITDLRIYIRENKTNFMFTKITNCDPQDVPVSQTWRVQVLMNTHVLGSFTTSEV